MKDSEDTELPIKYSKCAHYVVAGLSFPEIADKLGVSSRTIFRWVRLSAVESEIRTLRRALIEHSTNRLMRLSDKAISTLESLLDSPNHPTRCRAAVSILDKNQSGIEFYEYSERLRLIESRFDNENK